MPAKRDRPDNNKKDPTSPGDYWTTKQELDKKAIKLFTQTIFQDWCKACGICIAFCPAKVFGRDQLGHPTIDQPDACTGCRFCELHCPDFAVSITERYPDRRRRNNDR